MKIFAGSIILAAMPAGFLGCIQSNDDSQRTIVSPVIFYSPNSVTDTVGAVVKHIPNNTGDSISSCAVSPPLPVGFSIDSACTIYGMPTHSSAAQIETVTATSPGGINRGILTLAVVNFSPFNWLPGWNVINLPTPGQGGGLACPTADICYTGNLKTANGGLTWARRDVGWMFNPPGPEYYFQSVYFTDENTGYVGGWDYVGIGLEPAGFLVKTANGGEAFQRMTIPYLPSLGHNTVNSIYFMNLNTGWIVEHTFSPMTVDYIFKTLDGGLTWTGQYTDSVTSLNAIYFTNGNLGWAVGGGGSIVNTLNGGMTWSPQISGTTINLQSVAFVDANIGWTVGDSGTILKTLNGGNAWVAQTSGTNNGLSSVYCLDANVCYVIGAAGTILKTTNGGNTWDSQISGTTVPLYSIACPDVNTCYAGGGVTLLKTTSGGE